jgi:hypothetical protein
MIKGHITICKVYNDGTQEVVLDKANMITKGLGSSVIDIQKGLGGEYVENFVPYYFQVGTSTVDVAKFDTATSAYFYQLSTPLEWSEYGEDTDLLLESRYRGFYASSEDAGVTYTELFGTSSTLSSTVFSGVDEYFGKITGGKVTKYYLDSFESEIVLDENSANGQDISEVGLFSKNPKGFREDSPLLIAYRNFTPVTKNSEFSLIIHWTIGFLGITTNIDEFYTGGPGEVSLPNTPGKIISGPI